MDGVGHRLAGDPLHLAQVAVEGRRQRHRQAGQQRLAMFVDVGVEFEAARAPDGLGRLLRLRDLGRVAEQAELVVHAHQRAAGVDRVRGGRPVARLLGDVGHDDGHLAARVLRGPHVVGRDHGLGRVGVEDVDPHRQQEGRAVLQGRLHQVADKGTHLPQAEALGEGLDGEEAHVQAFARAFLPQVKAVGARILDRVVVDDLVAQFAPVVVVQVGRGGRVDAIRVHEQRTPVDQVGRIADAVGQRRRAQRGRHAVAQADDALAVGQVGGIGLDRDADHQAEVSDRVVEALGQAVVCAVGQVRVAAPSQLAVEVVVARRPAERLGLLDLVAVFHAQVGVPAQWWADVGRGEEVELDARVGWAVRVERHQHVDHAVVGAALRHDLQEEAHAVLVDEQLLLVEVGDVGQPAGELVGGRFVLVPEREQARAGLVAGPRRRRVAEQVEA